MQRPLATVIVFGIATDTFLTMLVLPVMYLLFGKAARTVEANSGEHGSTLASPVESMAS